HPTQRTPLMRRRIGTEGKTEFFRRVSQIIKNNARLHAHDSSLGIYLDNLIEIFREVQHDGGVTTLPRDARPRATRKNGRAKFSRGRYRRNDVIHRSRDDNADWYLPVIRGVRRIQRAGTSVEADFAGEMAL